MRVAVLVVALMVTSCVTSEGTTATPTTTPSTTAPTAPATTESVATTPETGAATTTTAPAAPTTTLGPLIRLEYRKVATLDFPVQLTALPGADIAYLITKSGRVWAYQGGEVSGTPVLDITSQVRNSGEQGLLSIALDPGHLYLHYSDNSGDTVVSRFDLSDPKKADPASEAVLLRVDQPASNHNGGLILLIDDHLYLGLGDGGGANDRFGNGQNQQTLLGGIVSISTVGDPSPELFAYGLRNPWRFWVDDGLLYVADVGQNTYEEVSVTDFAPGQNFGWPITEGLHCFRSAKCDPSGTVIPLVEIAHGDEGTCSITGGVVYRGSAIPEIYGSYLYSDYCGGYLRSLRVDGGKVVDSRDWTSDVGVPGRVVGFGVDGDNVVYVMTTNAVYRLAAVR